MTDEEGAETSIFELTDSGKAARVRQILERMEHADQALKQRDELGDKRVYEEVKSYVLQFEGIAYTHDFTDFLKNRHMGTVRKSDVIPVIERIANDSVTVANPERYPLEIYGAESFIGLNTVTVQWKGQSGELSSDTEVSNADLYVPASVSEHAYRQTLRFQANIGLEIDPGEIAVVEDDPV